MFYLKNTTSKLQAMDQGVVANLKKNYAQRMLNVTCMEARKAKTATDIIREIKIFDAILHANVAWEGVTAGCIQRCFHRTGVTKATTIPSPPPSPTDEDNEEDTGFAKYFQELFIYVYIFSRCALGPVFSNG